MCYALLKLDKPSGDYYVTRDSSDVKYLDNKTVLANLRMDYGLESPFDVSTLVQGLSNSYL